MPPSPSPALHPGVGVGEGEGEKPQRPQPPAKAIVRVLLDRWHIVLWIEADATHGAPGVGVHDEVSLEVLHEMPQRADPCGGCEKCKEADSRQKRLDLPPNSKQMHGCTW